MAAITSAQTGNWNSTSTWTGGVIPVSGDTVTISHAVTVPVGYEAVCGTSPTNNSGAVALTINAALTINGTLRWRGPVRQGNGLVTVGAGGTITYDASGAATPATALYTWQVGSNSSQANAKVILNGSSGSHVTINSTGNVRSGGWGTTGSSFTDSGNLVATYADVSYQGANTASGNWWTARIGTAGTYSTANCTFDNCGQVNVPALGGAATFSVTNCRIKNPANTTYAFQITGTTAKTSGTRVFNNNRVEGNGQVYCLATGGAATGFVVKNNIAAKFVWPGGGTVEEWDQNFCYQISESTSHDPLCRPPAATLNKSILYRQASTTYSNPHPVYVSMTGGDCIFEKWIFQYCGPGTVGDMIEITGDASVTRQMKVLRSIFLANMAGTVCGSLINNSSGVAQTNVKITFDHNTIEGATAAPPSNVTFGVGAEAAGTSIPAGGIPSVRSNSVRLPSNGAHLLVNSNNSATVANNAVTAADYNNAYRVTSSMYGAPAGQFASTPGTHDTAVDPQYTEPTRSILNFDQGYLEESVATAWATATVYAVGDVRSTSDASFYGGATFNYRCIVAHTSASTDKPGVGNDWADHWEAACIEPITLSILAGETVGENSMIGELVDWIRAGFSPTNALLQNAGHDGETVGAVGLLAPPAPIDPSGLAAATNDAAPTSAIDLEWSDNSNDETGFEIERSPNGSTGWTLIHTTAADATSFTDTGLSSNTTYYYRVRAVNDDGDSGYTAVASATTERVVVTFGIGVPNGILFIRA